MVAMGSVGRIAPRWPLNYLSYVILSVAKNLASYLRDPSPLVQDDTNPERNYSPINYNHRLLGLLRLLIMYFNIVITGESEEIAKHLVYLGNLGNPWFNQTIRKAS